ncbi:MAG: BON domain-containing protein [Methylobacterium sp.]
MNDKLIRQNVIDELDFEPSIDAAHIGVAVDKGLVTLTGHVGTYAQRVAAEKAVRMVRGMVAGIIDKVEVSPKASVPEIRAKIMAALKRNAELEADAKVTLEGKVNAWHERGLAENAAWSAPGVRGVDDRLTLA